MNISLIKLTVIALMCFPYIAKAEGKFFIELDPIAYALNGYSLHGGVKMDRFRFQIGAFGIDVPAATTNNQNYQLRMEGIGFKIDYFGKSDHGAFVGIEYGFSNVRYTLPIANFTDTRPANMAGIRIGYKYMSKKGFYVTPWLGIDKNLSDTSPINPTGEKYNIPEYIIFPTVHLGIQF